MSKDVAKRVMNWDGIGDNEKSILIYISTSFHKSTEKMMSSYLNAASLVKQGHDLFAKSGRDGKFSEWVETELKISRSSAYNMLKVSEKFGVNCPTVGQFSPTAMIELSSSNLPDDVIGKAVELADGGKVTGSIAKKAKAAATLEIPMEDATVTETEVDDEEPITAPNDSDTEYEDVDPPEPTKTTTKAQKPKEQQLKELAALGSKYVDILMRTLDDMQGLKKSDRHESGLKSCRELKKFFGTW